MLVSSGYGNWCAVACVRVCVCALGAVMQGLGSACPRPWPIAVNRGGEDQGGSHRLCAHPPHPALACCECPAKASRAAATGRSQAHCLSTRRCACRAWCIWRLSPRNAPTALNSFAGGVVGSTALARVSGAPCGLDESRACGCAEASWELSEASCSWTVAGALHRSAARWWEEQNLCTVRGHNFSPPWGDGARRAVGRPTLPRLRAPAAPPS